MTQTQTKAKRHMGGVITAAILVVLGGVLWVDSYSLLDPDAYVFPRVMIIGMTVTGSLVVVRDLWRARAQEAHPAGDNLRRILLVLLMLLSTALIPFIGMAVSLVLLMAAAIELSRFESWTTRQRMILHGFGLFMALTLTVVFREFLYVPLPTGSLWG